MSSLRLFVLAGLALAGPGCRPHLVLPDLDATPGPFYPPPPDDPRVVWVGALTGPGQGFRYPLDVACGEGTLAVADPDAHAIWVVDLDNGAWHTLIAVQGRALEAPVGVAWSGGDLVGVDAQRALVARWKGGRGGAAVVAEGAPLQRPVAAVGLPDGGLIVADTGAHALYRSLPAGGLGELATTDPSGAVGLNAPVDLALGPDGAVYVTDALAGQVFRVADGSVSLAAGRPGVGGDGLVRPKGLAFAGDGLLHVVDAGMQHVQVFGPEGRLMGRYGNPGAEAGALALPGGICFDAGGRAFVADPLHHQVQIYRVLPAAQ